MDADGDDIPLTHVSRIPDRKSAGTNRRQSAEDRRRVERRAEELVPLAEFVGTITRIDVVAKLLLIEPLGVDRVVEQRFVFARLRVIYNHSDQVDFDHSSANQVAEGFLVQHFTKLVKPCTEGSLLIFIQNDLAAHGKPPCSDERMLDTAYHLTTRMSSIIKLTS